MNKNNRKRPVVNPGQCRCCGAVKKCRLLTEEYEWSGQREVYADMFVDCFGLVLSHLDGEVSKRVICATCVMRLREACAFRRQVLMCEEKLLSAMVHTRDDNEVNFKMKREVDEEVKQEVDVEVEQEVDVTPSQTLKESDKDDDDDHHATDPIEDSEPMDNIKITATMSIKVEAEEPQDSAVEHQSPPRGRESATVDAAKRGMLNKLNSMKRKLDEMQKTDDNEVNFKMKREVDEEVKQEVDVEVEQEVDVTPSQTLKESDKDDDDDHHATDPIEDSEPMDNIKITATMSIKVEAEEPQDSAVEHQSPPRGRESATVDAAKRGMLNKLNSMKRKLDEMQKTDDTRRAESPPQRRPVTVDKDLHAFRNAVKIVEYSYVCPFVNLYNDYHCIYCREMFLDPTQLREHTMTHDPKAYKDVLDNKKLIQIDIERIDCRLCDEKIDNIDSFKQHITSVHGQKLYKDVDKEFMPFKLKIGTLSCAECGKNASVFQALKNHMAVHYGSFVCDVCGAHYFEEQRLKIHRKSHNKTKPQMFSCDECGKTFRSKYSRNFHVTKIHKKEPAYPCNKCEEIFMSYDVRYTHKINVHGEKRLYPCEGCDKVFNSRRTLREHNKRAHLKILKHECSLCDKKFYLPSALKDHMTSHTGERNFRCEVCGKNYPRARALRVHLQSHSAEKKYKCTLCPSAYTQVTNLKNHMKTKHPSSE